MKSSHELFSGKISRMHEYGEALSTSPFRLMHFWVKERQLDYLLQAIIQVSGN